MEDRDIEMNIRFKTNCPRCGIAWMIESVVLEYGAEHFQHYVASMRKSLEKNQRTCCGKKLPVIGEKWERVWP